jgi:regulation of enolase protein 1 (concanavalin A-like superfamily)
VRQGYLTEEPELLVGVMAAAPEGPGFDAIFRDLRIERA